MNAGLVAGVRYSLESVGDGAVRAGVVVVVVVVVSETTSLGGSMLIFGSKKEK